MQGYMIARQNLETLQGVEVKDVEEQGLRKGQKAK